MKFLSSLLLIFFFNLSINSKEVKIIQEIEGDGIEIVNHSKVSVHYIGMLEDKTEFDNSYKRNQTFKFQIGTRQVILGWETGLIGMKEGGKRSIFVPHELAYGDKGAGDLIPPKSNLIFEIEVINVIPPKYKQIDSYQLILALTDKSFKVLDIRNINEINKSGKIPGSIIMTAFDKYGNFYPDFLKDFQKEVGPNHKVIFVSQNGSISSILANGFVEQLKFDNIYNLKDGIEGLKEINFDFDEFNN